MAGTTAQSLINRVLTSLRNTITTVTVPLTDTYQLLILEFFNEIKQEVEDSTDWRSLYKTVTVTIPANSYFAQINGSNERSRVIRAPIVGGGMDRGGYAPSISGSDSIVAMVFDTTSASSPRRLFEMPLNQLLFNVANTNAQTTQQPQFFAIGGPSADNGLQGTNTLALYVYPPVSNQRTIQVTLAIPQSDFTPNLLDSANNQTIWVPASPILMGLQWMAREERGEELGPSNAFSESKYREVLDDAVGIEEAAKGNSLDLVLL